MTLPQIPDRWLPILAALLLGVAALLAVRVGLQLQDLNAAHRETGYQEGLVRDHAARTGGATTGAALIAAPVSQASLAAAERMRRELAAAGIKVVELEVLERRPGGTNLQVVRLGLRGYADAPAADRLARWIEKRGDAVVLERLLLATGEPGAPAAEISADLAVLVATAGQGS
ncbi:MAG: hypothetical protein K0R83_1591 [Caulobacter sp.]|jgi:hypothetical protein|nr:hypothetical protein [Caulobacter sp.]